MKPTKKTLDKLWADCIKARAKYKSEYSGKTGILHAHHIHGKSNYRLRWELANGVCLTGGEHKFIAHHTGRQGQFKKWAIEKRSFSEEKALLFSRILGGTDLFGVQEYLKLKLKEFEAELCEI